jgi:hypothetical protein
MRALRRTQAVELFEQARLDAVLTGVGHRHLDDDAIEIASHGCLP